VTGGNTTGNEWLRADESRIEKRKLKYTRHKGRSIV